MMYERYLVDERYTYATNTVTGTTRAKKPCLEWHLTLSQFFKAILDMQRISFHLNYGGESEGVYIGPRNRYRDITKRFDETKAMHSASLVFVSFAPRHSDPAHSSFFSELDNCRCYPQPANEHQIEFDLNCITIQ